MARVALPRSLAAESFSWHCELSLGRCRRLRVRRRRGDSTRIAPGGCSCAGPTAARLRTRKERAGSSHRRGRRLRAQHLGERCGGSRRSALTSYAPEWRATEEPPNTSLAALSAGHGGRGEVIQRSVLGGGPWRAGRTPRGPGGPARGGLGPRAGGGGRGGGVGAGADSAARSPRGGSAWPAGAPSTLVFRPPGSVVAVCARD